MRYAVCAELQICSNHFHFGTSDWWRQETRMRSKRYELHFRVLLRNGLCASPRSMHSSSWMSNTEMSTVRWELCKRWLFFEVSRTNLILFIFFRLADQRPQWIATTSFDDRISQNWIKSSIVFGAVFVKKASCVIIEMENVSEKVNATRMVRSLWLTKTLGQRGMFYRTFRRNQPWRLSLCRQHNILITRSTHHPRSIHPIHPTIPIPTIPTIQIQPSSWPTRRMSFALEQTTAWATKMALIMVAQDDLLTSHYHHSHSFILIHLIYSIVNFKNEIIQN